MPLGCFLGQIVSVSLTTTLSATLTSDGFCAMLCAMQENCLTFQFAAGTKTCQIFKGLLTVLCPYMSDYPDAQKITVHLSDKYLVESKNVIDVVLLINML